MQGQDKGSKDQQAHVRSFTGNVLDAYLDGDSLDYYKYKCTFTYTSIYSIILK